MATRTLNRVMVKEGHCTSCNKLLPVGTKVCVFRERALSSHEAMHAGTMYPKRRWCATCAGITEAR